MNINHVLLFCSLSALCDGNTGLVNANTQLIRTEGSSALVACHFSLSGRRKFLCKDECKEDDVLIETEGDRAQRGRYSILYKEGTFPVSSTVLYVSITQLTKADSGQYRCGLERKFLPDSYRAFEVRVTEAPKTLTEAVKQPEQQQTETTAAAAAVYSVKVSPPGYVLPLVVCVAVVVLFAVVVLLLYKLKTSLNTRGQSGDRNMEFTTYKKSSPVSKCEDSTSPAVHEASNDQHKIYCNI
ncbi:uncharacterized protein LOC144464119 isoform X1 [Epinephelus lanceolatus]